MSFTSRSTRQTKQDLRLCYLCYKKRDNRCEFLDGKEKCTYCDDLKEEKTALIRCSREEKHKRSQWPAREAKALREQQAAAGTSGQ